MKYVFLYIGLLLSTFSVKAQVFAETQKIVASDREELAKFGQSVAISGNYAVVGAYGSGPFNNGQIYIFEKQGSNWVQTQILQNSDNENYDRFGYSVAIYGDYIVVGAYGEDDDINGNNNLSKAGSAYIFKNTNGTWTETQKIIANDRSSNDEFGWSVDINGNTIVVGAHFEDEDENGLNTIYHAGSVYIFELNGGTGIWSQSQKIVASSRAADLTYPTGGNAGEDVSDLFGHSVSISGNYLVVGSLNHDWDETNTVSTLNGGAIYIFEKNLGTWSEVKKIVNSDVHVSDRFGSAVTIDSNFIAIGSYSHDYSLTGTNYMPNSGAVYICKRDASGNWTEQQKLVAPTRNTGDRFGWSVDLDSLYLIIGTIEDNDNKNETNPLVDAGAAHIFTRNNITGTYTHLQKLDASDRDSLDLFGNAVGVDGTTIIISALEQDFNSQHLDSMSNSGAAYIYSEISCPTVSVTQNLTICNGQNVTVGSNSYNSNGTYQDTLTSINGCDSVVITNLSVTNGFEITQNVNICYGETYSIGNSIYSIPGNYSDTLQMLTGTCDSIVYTNLSVIPPIDISVDVNDNNIKSNQNNAFYQWVDCDNDFQFITNTLSNQRDIDIVETGNYAVIINVNGCVDTSACVLVEYIGIDENILNGNLIHLYPNPAYENLAVSNSDISIIELQIIDFSGKIIYSNTPNNNQLNINISALRPGLYVVKIITENQIIIKQFIKQ